MTLDEQTILRVAGCRSDFELGQLIGNIEIDNYKGLTSLTASALELDAKPDPDTKAHVAEMITAVRGGKHMALSITALTFRQRKAPNRRYLRLAADKLEARAPSWKGTPFLTDHNTYSMTASKGVITSSKLVQESTNVAAFEQVLQVVKPDAVIGFLDGTWRKFSVGWFALGPVMCTVHSCDVRASGSCSCWPGDTVMIDGKPEIVQYEFSDYEGKETSTVVIPAVRDTSVEEIRAALTAELHLPSRRSTPKERAMPFPKLAAALALAALTESDEDRAVTAVTGLRERAAAAELDAGTQRAEVTRLTAELAVQTTLAATAGAAATDALVAEAYKSGKLLYGKDAEGKNTPDALESLLRDYGKTAGRDKLAAKLSEMSARAPLGQPAIAATTTEAPKAQLAAVPTDIQLAATAAQLGIPVNDLRAQYGLAPLGQAAGGVR